MRTNAPRMVTVVLAVALTAVGLSLTVFHLEAVNAPVMNLAAEIGLRLGEQRLGWLALLLSPLALVAGSLFRGV